MKANGGCQHVCMNNITSYRCFCHSGYLLEVDGHSCKGNIQNNFVCTIPSIFELHYGWPLYAFQCTYILLVRIHNEKRVSNSDIPMKDELVNYHYICHYIGCLDSVEWNGGLEWCIISLSDNGSV